MTTSPTIAAFMAQPTDDLDETAAPEEYGPGLDIRSELHGDPLESIADSLRTLVGMVTKHSEDEQLADRRLELLDDLEAKHAELWDVLATVEKIVAKSTSKVSLEVKAAINAWRNPEVPDEAADTAACAQCGETFPNVVELQAHGTRAHGADFDYRDVPTATMPAHDADVQDWRDYALAVAGDQFELTGLDQINRSQIRTMLGIEQPTGGAQ